DWHVHSRWSSDAEGAIPDYCRQARANGLKLIAFTEHVRRKIRFDYAEFAADVEAARREFPDLTILKGCEAKVLNVNGDLDVPEQVLEECDVVVGSFHSFSDPSEYVTALEHLIKNPQVDVWGHPTLYAVRNGVPLDLATVERLIDLCIEHDVLIEFNAKYRLPSDTMRALVVRRGAKHVFGSDGHRVDALRSRKDEL